MEKISIKLNNLHLEYSPQKKIELLLKACKIIYDSMSVSSPGQNNPVTSNPRCYSNITVLIITKLKACFLLVFSECVKGPDLQGFIEEYGRDGI